jgi:hypothetical protein
MYLYSHYREGFASSPFVVHTLSDLISTCPKPACDRLPCQTTSSHPSPSPWADYDSAHRSRRSRNERQFQMASIRHNGRGGQQPSMPRRRKWCICTEPLQRPGSAEGRNRSRVVVWPLCSCSRSLRGTVRFARVDGAEVYFCTEKRTEHTVHHTPRA